jgi:hypothetical protein
MVTGGEPDSFCLRKRAVEEAIGHLKGGRVIQIPVRSPKAQEVVLKRGIGYEQVSILINPQNTIRKRVVKEIRTHDRR